MGVLRMILDWFGGGLPSLPVVLLFLFFTDRQRFVKKWGWLVLFTLYMNATMIIIGTPAFSYITWDPTINWIPFRDFSTSNLVGMCLNILLFVPFGGFLPIYFPKFRKLIRTVLAGFLMSLFIELLQLFTFRATDVDDLVMNTLGAAAGYGIAHLLFRKSVKTGEGNGDVWKLMAIILIIVLGIFFVRYPLTGWLFRVLRLDV